MSDVELRIRALEMALATETTEATPLAGDVVKTAEAYFAFLMGKQP